MTRTFYLLLGLFCSLILSPFALAESDTDSTKTTEETNTKQKKKKTKKPESPVVKALKKTKKISGRLNSKADYYILLYSASYCGPCCREMPEIVKHYKKIHKDKRVELVLMGCDKTPEEAAAFAKHFDMKFYVTLSRDEKASQIPGAISPRGIPTCVVIDRYGRQIRRGHPGSIVSNWKAIAELGEPEPPAETTSEE